MKLNFKTFAVFKFNLFLLLFLSMSPANADCFSVYPDAWPGRECSCGGCGIYYPTCTYCHRAHRARGPSMGSEQMSEYEWVGDP